MGEIADLIIEGLLDQETGEVIDGDAPGYPRTKRKRADRQSSKRHQCCVCGKRFRSRAGMWQHRHDVHRKPEGE